MRTTRKTPVLGSIRPERHRKQRVDLREAAVLLGAFWHLNSQIWADMIRTKEIFENGRTDTL
jgi:hypothetical protein